MSETGSALVAGLNVFSAISLGLAMPYGAVEIVRRWGGMTPTIERKRRGEFVHVANPRYYVALFSFAAIMLAEVALLGVVVYAGATAKTLPEVLPPALLWAWAFGRVAAASLVMAGLAAVIGAQPVRQVAQPNAQVAQVVAQPAQPVAQVAPHLRKDRRKVAQPERNVVNDADLLAQWTVNPRATNQEIARNLRVSRQAVSARKARLVKDGVIAVLPDKSVSVLEYQVAEAE
jgi:hypothetical protein